MSGTGELVLVATPIGNLADLAPRAIETLSRADVICCEDTRHSGLLLAKAGVEPKRLLSLNAHNEADRTGEILRLVSDGKLVAVVTDAGMPAISDPGARLVAAVHREGGRVTAVPGASACVTAMAVSGFLAQRWRFEGFLPRRGAERRARLAEIAGSPVPSVVYEAPHRVATLLAELEDACGADRPVAVCRELTKLHEEVWRGPVGGARSRWEVLGARGEFAVVVSGAPPVEPEAPSPAELRAFVEEEVLAGSTRRDAVSTVARRLGLKRRQVYEAALGQQ